jgi:hypothetical protein
MKLQIGLRPAGLRRVPSYRRLMLGVVALGLALWIVLVSPGAAFARPNAEPPQNTTDSDLSDIPNLEQMDYDKFEKYIGDVPADRKPLLNPDNAKSQTIKAKDPRSKTVITPADLQERPSDRHADRPSEHQK